MHLKCSAYETHRCKSCTLIGDSYLDGVKLKEEKVISYLSLHRDIFKKTVGISSPTGFRNKLKLSCYQDDSGEIFFGIYDRNLNFFPLEDCPLHMPRLNDFLPLLKELLTEFKVSAYDVKEKKGELKRIYLAKDVDSESYTLRFVLRSTESVPRLKKCLLKLQHLQSLTNPQFKIIASANILPLHSAQFEGEHEINLCSETELIFHWDNIKFFVGTKNFLQVNPEMAIALYRHIAHFLKENQIDSMVELFSGIGLFSFFSASKLKSGLGIELNSQSVDLALKTKDLNNLGHINFIQKDLYQLDFFTEFHWLKDCQCLLLNPPRAGAGTKTLQTILKIKPKYLIYSSCSIESLAKDCQLLSQSYEIISTQVFDMFAWTEHFETLVIFKKLER